MCLVGVPSGLRSKAFGHSSMPTAAYGEKSKMLNLFHAGVVLFVEGPILAGFIYSAQGLSLRPIQLVPRLLSPTMANVTRSPVS